MKAKFRNKLRIALLKFVCSAREFLRCPMNVTAIEMCAGLISPRAFTQNCIQIFSYLNLHILIHLCLNFIQSNPYNKRNREQTPLLHNQYLLLDLSQIIEIEFLIYREFDVELFKKFSKQAQIKSNVVFVSFQQHTKLSNACYLSALKCFPCLRSHIISLLLLI